ncbi:MAG TPA: hypothetical protein PLA68_01540, partial [Panacibacter sp.]|nr:hypothetical protein [Panacibacter sp.]
MKRVAVTISFSFAIRYLIRTGMAEKMRLFCHPVICLFWHQADLMEELEGKGFEVYLIPVCSSTTKYKSLRTKIDYWFKFTQLKSPTQKTEPRYLEKFQPAKKVIINRLRDWYNWPLMHLPFYVSGLLKRETELLHTDTNFSEMCNLIVQLNIDAVFTVTPFHRQEDIFLRAASLNGKKMITSILSFDNIVKRGWIPVVYDAYMVWNNDMRNQLKRINKKVPEENIHIVGAAQFDFYKNPAYILKRNDWLKAAGLPEGTNKKIILFAGGPVSLFPQEYQFLKDVKEALENKKIEGGPLVLFRCHPMDNIERWKEKIGQSEHIFFDGSWTGTRKPGEANITDADIKKLCSTLFYTDVHINTASTMMVDGSAFAKPQIGPGYDNLYPAKRWHLSMMYLQEYYLPIMKANALLHPKSKEELVEHINMVLKN